MFIVDICGDSKVFFDIFGEIIIFFLEVWGDDLIIGFEIWGDRIVFFVDVFGVSVVFFNDICGDVFFFFKDVFDMGVVFFVEIVVISLEVWCGDWFEDGVVLGSVVFFVDLCGDKFVFVSELFGERIIFVFEIWCKDVEDFGVIVVMLFKELCCEWFFFLLSEMLEVIFILFFEVWGDCKVFFVDGFVNSLFDVLEVLGDVLGDFMSGWDEVCFGCFDVFFSEFIFNELL